MNDHQNDNDAIRGFAKGGIAAAITINSGALITSLSQSDTLLKITGTYEFSNALETWAFGVSAAAVAWVFALIAASAFANGHRKLEITMASTGIIFILISVACFLLGFLNISYGIRN